MVPMPRRRDWSEHRAEMPVDPGPDRAPPAGRRRMRARIRPNLAAPRQCGRWIRSSGAFAGLGFLSYSLLLPSLSPPFVVVVLDCSTLRFSSSCSALFFFLGVLFSLVVEKQLFLRWSLRFDFVFACALRPVGGQCVV
jgi:hypothetical protein